MKIRREKIIEQAYNECLQEMYAKAQPPADFKKLVEDVKEGKITDTDKEPIYSQHYLSHEEFEYIRNKYIEAYGLKNNWEPHINIVKGYFIGEGKKDIWVEGKTDINGIKHSGYRSYENVPHIKETVSKILKEELGEDNELIAKKISHTIIQYIDNCKEYYNLDVEKQSFSASIALGCSPSSNKDSVIEYWKKQGKEFEIKEKNPDLLWDMDYYGDEFEEVMIDTYGENWEEITWEKYYSSNQGKKKLVNDFLDKNKEYQNYYIKNGNEDKLIVINFKNSKEVYDIDEFIKLNNIK